jgi:peptidyl-prolyl cis-trans isomerase C
MNVVSARHILVNSLEEAQSLKKQIVTEEDFAKLAAAHSKCPSGKNGGNLGIFGKGQMVKPFEEATFNMTVGSISDPVQTQFGYHLIYRTA